MASQIKLRRDTAANWTAANPVLGAGEPGYDTTNGKLKIGNGTTAWNLLPYFDDKVTDFSSVAANIVPDADNTRDLGAPDKQWRHVYTAGGSIYLDNIKLTNVDGKFTATKVINPGEENEAPDPEDSDATSEISGGANLGSLKISGSTLGTVNNPDTGGWGGYDLYIQPGGPSEGYNALIYLPNTANQTSGAPLQIINNATSTSLVQLFGRGGVQIVTNIGEAEEVFDFGNDGKLRLPVGGDILNANGDSVLGGGGASELTDLSDVFVSLPTQGQILKYNGATWVNDTQDGLPTVTVPGDQGTTYKGLQVSYGMIHSNSSNTEYNVNKIVIYKPSPAVTTMDETTNTDLFEVSGLDSDVLAMFVFYGDTNGAKSLSTLQAFAEAAIDNVILTDGEEGQYETIADMRSNFYANYATLATAAGGLYDNFQFFNSGINLDPAAATTVRQGSGASFIINNEGDGTYSPGSVTGADTNYLVGHKLLITGDLLFGTTPTNDCIITVTGVVNGAIDTYTVSGVAPGTEPGSSPVLNATNYNVGSGATISFIGLNNDLTIQYVNFGLAGTNYVAGDVVTLPGTAFVNGTSPANDITLVVSSVDGSGAIQGVGTSGTVAPSWPNNNISDGGSDQYDTANYISTNLFSQIPYNNGQITAGTAYFGAGSSYATVYQDSIFGVLATGSSAVSIRTSGNSGADGSSVGEAGNIYGPDTVSQTFTNAVTHINLVGDVFAGPLISFTRPDDEDGTIDILIPDDGEGSGVAFARESNQYGIYNPYREAGWDQDTELSPLGTLWNLDGWANFADVESRTYAPLLETFGGGGLGNKIVGAELVMYLPDNGKYYAVKFDAWTQNGNGGGFTYTRRELDLNSLEEGIRFADGTKLKSAEGIGRVKLESPGSRRIEEVYGYKQVSVTEIVTTNLSTTAESSVVNSQVIWIDSLTSTIDDILDNPSNYGNAREFQFSLDNNTWYTWGGSTSFNGDLRGYSIFPATVTYNQGDTVYFRYKTGGEPQIWWDKNDLPAGGSNFRGAVIDYHAYTGESTIIGTIHIVDDDGEEHITHTEVSSGGTDGENDYLWLVQNEGTVSYRRIDGESKTLKVQWSAKVFYGSELYD